MTRPAALLDDWLQRFAACDLPGLVDLYAPRAELAAIHEIWRGRDEIESGLQMAKRWIRDVELESVEPMGGSGRGFSFETHVKGRLGRLHIRHTWTLDAGRIAGHDLQVIRHDKHA